MNRTGTGTGARATIRLEKNPAGIFIAQIEDILSNNPAITRDDFILYLIEESHSKILLKVVPTLRNHQTANCGEITESVNVDQTTNPFSHKAKHSIDSVKKALMQYYGFKIVCHESYTTWVFRQNPGQNGILDY